MKQRLQKIISGYGIASRRAAETMIMQKRVTVNGIAAKLGDTADPDTDMICVDQKPIAREPERLYIMLNKPRGYVTTMSDEKGRKTVYDLVMGLKERVYPVGRLDMDSEGLLILTNDGAAANRLMHPSSEVQKTYHVWVEGNIDAIALSRPMVIDGYPIRPAQVRIINQSDGGGKLEIGIFEGRNRQIRKMCGQCGLKVKRLKRVSEGKLHLGTLETGRWRLLTEDEKNYIKNL